MRTFAGHQGHSEWVKKTRAGIISDCSPSYHTLHLLFFYFSLRDERPFILRGKVLATLQEWQMHLFLPWPKNKGWEKSEVEKILSSGRRSYPLSFCASSTYDCGTFVFWAFVHMGMWACAARVCMYLLLWFGCLAERWQRLTCASAGWTIFTPIFLKSQFSPKHFSNPTQAAQLPSFPCLCLVTFGALVTIAISTTNYSQFNKADCCW